MIGLRGRQHAHLFFLRNGGICGSNSGVRRYDRHWLGGGRMKDVLGVTLRLCAKGACVPCLLSEGEGGLRVLLLSAP